MRLLTTILFLHLTCAVLQAQPAYVVGSKVADMPLALVLNHSGPAQTFDSLRRRLTILDFFGTWCIPCVRALPHLDSIQRLFPDSVRVLLVSIESEAKLRAFLAKQPSSLPLIVDSGEAFSRHFAPPSYPYTVVLDSEGRIITLTETHRITDNSVRYWLSRGARNPDSTRSPGKSAEPSMAPWRTRSGNAVVQLSQDFVYAARTGEPIDQYRRLLEALTEKQLLAALPTDNAKKAFWINLYNGYVQALLREDPSRYKSRKAFFSTKHFTVGGHAMSLDDIEHGLLRHSRTKTGRFLPGKLFPPGFERQQRVENIDYRIHFALNCGARSCPPIAFYTPENVDRQLEIATDNYLQSEVMSSPSDNIVDVPAIVGWFRNDFGGKKGIRKLLEDKGFIKPGTRPNLRFQEYDWTMELNSKII
ncbi:MAG: DUF547 domain-containing protein [Chitinophagaceae bacterium]|nr:MAG: DUF547 domain-containing protein [Chitinophagaceae bacterium]